MNMQLASLIVATTSLVVSATTLVVIVVGAKRAQAMVAEVSAQAEGKVNALKKALADI